MDGILNDELLKPQEVANILKVTPQAVYQMKKRGTIEAVNLGMKSVRFRRSEIERLVQGRAKSAPVA